MTSARLDHVLFAVPDLDGAGAMLLEEHGLASVEGGRHPGWGTANRILPLGREYVELVGIVDDTEALTHPFGSAVRARVEQGGGPIGWCLAVDDVEGVASRLGLAVTDGERERPDGVTLRWRLAGLEAALAEPWRPFYIEWRIPEDAHPALARAPHRVEPVGVAWLELACDLQVLEEWVGDAHVDVRLGEGPPGLLSVGIATREGEVVLG
ncbi:MAG: VOC family protein [Actinomycetota bacterium]